MTLAVAEHHPESVPAFRGRQTVMGSLAERYSMDPTKLLDTLRATCIKGNATNEQVQAFLIVAKRYDLDPFLKEIHAFAAQGGGIVPIVGIDGWSKIANGTGKMNGVEFRFEGDGPALACTCTVFVKGREHHVSVTEYLSECKRNTPPWNQYPRRMLRHRAFIQAVRLVFGFGGIYDEDEAREIVNNEAGIPTVTTGRPDLKARMLEDTQLPEEELAQQVATAAVPSPTSPEPEPTDSAPAGAGEDGPAYEQEQPVPTAVDFIMSLQPEDRQSAVIEAAKKNGLTASQRSLAWTAAMVALGTKSREDKITDEQWRTLAEHATNGTRWFEKPAAK